MLNDMIVSLYLICIDLNVQLYVFVGMDVSAIYVSVVTLIELTIHLAQEKQLSV